MSKTFDPNIAREYQKKLNPIAVQIEQHRENRQPAPTQAEIKAATTTALQYYDYLIDTGVPYGQAAKDAATNHGAYGRLANSYFKMQAKAEGKTDAEIPTILDQLKIRLAFDDSSSRMNSYNIDSQGNIKYKDIANYHYDNLKMFKLSKHAWGGTFFEEFAGSGSWMDFGGYDTKVDVQQSRLLEALATNKKVDGVSAWEYVAKLKSLGVENKAETTTALVYRAALGMEDNSITKMSDGTMFVKGMSEAQIAQKFKVSTDRIIENYGVNEDLQGRPYGQKIFMIIPESKKSTDSIAKAPSFADYFGTEALYNSFQTLRSMLGGKAIDADEFDYSAPIKTTGGSYDFINKFSEGKYSSPLEVYKHIYLPFNHWSKNLELYDKGYAETLKKIRDTEITLWTQKNFHEQNQYCEQPLYDRTLKLEQKVWNMPNYNNIYLQTYDLKPNNARVWEGTGVIQDPSGRVHWRIPTPIGNTDFSFKASEEHGGKQITVNLAIPLSALLGLIPWLPLAIDLENDGLKLVPLENSNVFYDIDGNGFLNNVGWPSKDDALLVVDIDEDGMINQAKEIAFKMWDSKATTDLEGFRLAFDKNNDGIIDEKDPDFDKLRVWQDRNQNGISELGEVKTLKDIGIEAFLLKEVAEVKEEKEQGGNKILKAVKILAPTNKKMGNLYDVMLKSSIAEVSYEKDFEEIILHYPDNTGTKIFKVENAAGQVVNLADADYTIALGSKAKDRISAGDTDTVIDGDGGDDILIGGDGNDWLKGGLGSDTLRGGKGHDILLIDSEDKQQNIDGGDGYDVVLVATKKAVNLNLTEAKVEAAYGNKGGDKFSAKHSLVGVTIDGGEGDDEIQGSDHDDIIIGGKGSDKIIAGKGNDSIFIDAEDSMKNIDAGEGEDDVFVYGSAGVSIDAAKIRAESVIGGLGNDRLINSGDYNVILAGNAGNDILIGGKGDDILDGGPGNDYLEGGLGNDKYLFYLGAGHDTIKNHNTGKDKDLVLIDSSINKEDMIFKMSGNDLKLTLKNNDQDSLTIQGWHKPKYGYSANNYNFITGDFNGDDKTDLAHLVNKNHLRVWHSNGNGTFDIKNPFPEATGGNAGYDMSVNNYNFQTGDFNGDGKTDLVHLAHRNYFQVWNSKGDGTFEIKKPFPGNQHTNARYDMSANNYNFQTGDFNGDGKTDLVHLAHRNYLQVWNSKGDGTFEIKAAFPGNQYTNARYDMSANNYNFQTGDFNGDAKTDLVHLAHNNYLQVWNSRGDGTFEIKSAFPGNQYTNVGYDMSANNYNFQTGDFNGDGKTDLVHLVQLEDMAYLHIWLSNGDGTFSIKRDFPASEMSRNLVPKNFNFQLGDANGDRKTDLIYLASNNSLHVWTTNGDGTFDIQPTFSGNLVESNVERSTAAANNYNFYSLKIGDFNGDGKVDLAQLMNNEWVQIWLSSNNEKFSILSQYTEDHNIDGFIFGYDINKPQAIVFKDGEDNVFSMQENNAGNVVFTME